MTERRQMTSVQQYLELPGYEPIPLPLADHVDSSVIIIPLTNRYQLYYLSALIRERRVDVPPLPQPLFETIQIFRKQWQIHDAELDLAWWEWRWDTDAVEQKFILDGRVKLKYR